MDTSVPPWLNIGPTDYLRAVQAGGSAGLGIAEAQNRAREAAARTAEAQRAAAQQQWEFGERMRQAAEEHAAQRDLEAARLAQTGQYQEGMLGYHNRSLDDAMQRAAMQNESRGNLLDLKAQHYNDLRDWRDREQSLKEQIAGNKVQPTDYETITETVPAVESAVPAQPARPFEKKSLLGIDWLWPDQQASPATPAIEPHGERKITRRVPIGVRLGASSPALEAPPEPLPSDNQLGTSVAPNIGSLLDVQSGVDQSWMSRPLSSVQPTEPTAGVVAVYDPKTKKFTSTVKGSVPETIPTRTPSFDDRINSWLKPPPRSEPETIRPQFGPPAPPPLSQMEVIDLYNSGKISQDEANELFSKKYAVYSPMGGTKPKPEPTPDLSQMEIIDLYKSGKISKDKANEMLSKKYASFTPLE